MHSTHTCTLLLPHLPKAATTAHILPGLSHSLLSIGKFCDTGMTATFDKHGVAIWHDDKTVLQGHRDTTTGLWMLPLVPPPCPCTTHHCHQSITTRSISDMLKYLHAALGSPTKSTLLAALANGYLQTWPGLTTSNVRNHFVEPDATIKGHLDQPNPKTPPSYFPNRIMVSKHTRPSSPSKKLAKSTPTKPVPSQRCPAKAINTSSSSTRTTLMPSLPTPQKSEPTGTTSRSQSAR